jgi:phytanoyl-CoA hydroxylase
MANYLTEEQKRAYDRDGYIVIPRFFDDAKVDLLRSVMTDIVNKSVSSGTPEHMSIFTTDEQDRKTDDYFLESGYAIRYFWEQRAWEGGALKVPATVAINKVGHGLHELVPEFEEISFDRRIGTICHELGMDTPLNVQSMYIFKQARVGGEVGAHQDGTFLFTNPQTVIGFWWALDDCTTRNGCLWAVPGSHKTYPVHRRFRRRDAPLRGTEFLPNPACPEPVEWDLSTAVPLEIPRGSLVILHAAVGKPF